MTMGKMEMLAEWKGKSTNSEKVIIYNEIHPPSARGNVHYVAAMLVCICWYFKFNLLTDWLFYCMYFLPIDFFHFLLIFRTLTDFEWKHRKKHRMFEKLCSGFFPSSWFSLLKSNSTMKIKASIDRHHKMMDLINMVTSLSKYGDRLVFMWVRNFIFLWFVYKTFNA